MSNHGRKIIVVDDDESVRSSFARLFRSAGMEFWLFASAEEFLLMDLIDDAGCMIIDAQMPGMRGIELQECCAKRRPSLPVIMISAFRDEEAEQQAIASGAIAFINKPFDASALLETVATAMARAD